MKKFLIPILSLLFAATGAMAQDVAEQASSKETFYIMRDGAQDPAGYDGFYDWTSASMVASIKEFGTQASELKGMKAVGLRFAVAASLGENASVMCNVYKTLSDKNPVRLSGELTDKNYNVSIMAGSNTQIYWNEVKFSEPYTFTGEEGLILYGYRYTQEIGENAENAKPVVFGKSTDTDYNNMFLVNGQPSADKEAGLYAVSNKKSPYVPSILLIVEKDGETSVIGINGADQPVAQQYFSVDGKKLSAPQKGLNIVKMSDGSTRKVLINK